MMLHKTVIKLTLVIIAATLASALLIYNEQIKTWVRFENQKANFLLQNMRGRWTVLLKSAYDDPKFSTQLVYS